MPSPPPQQPPVSRWTIALFSAGCLAGAAFISLQFPERDALEGALIRVGVVLGALAWALPRPGESVRWQGLAPLLIVIVLLMAATRKMILAFIPALVVIAVILKITRPKPSAPLLRKPRDS